MRPSTTEPLQSVAESPHSAQTELGGIRCQDAVFPCGADIVAFGGNVDSGIFELNVSPAATPTTDRRRADCRLSRKPSKLSLGSLSLTAQRPYSISPVSLSRAENGRGSFRQRSQSDVVHLATMAAREMKRTMEATQSMERTLQVSIGELDEALTRLKVITSGKQRAASMRLVKRPSRDGLAAVKRGESFGESPAEEHARPLTTEPEFFSRQQATATLGGELDTPLSIRNCQLVQSPLRRDEGLMTETTSTCDRDRQAESYRVFEFSDDWDTESLDEVDHSGASGADDDDEEEEEDSIDIPMYIVLTFGDSRSVSLSLDEFKRWLLAQKESWC